MCFCACVLVRQAARSQEVFGLDVAVRNSMKSKAVVRLVLKIFRIQSNYQYFSLKRVVVWTVDRRDIPFQKLINPRQQVSDRTVLSHWNNDYIHVRKKKVF